MAVRVLEVCQTKTVVMEVLELQGKVTTVEMVKLVTELEQVVEALEPTAGIQ
jgi:hypothetical protein